jgi:hypothetical protein
MATAGRETGTAPGTPFVYRPFPKGGTVEEGGAMDDVENPPTGERRSRPPQSSVIRGRIR